MAISVFALIKASKYDVGVLHEHNSNKKQKALAAKEKLARNSGSSTSKNFYLTSKSATTIPTLDDEKEKLNKEGKHLNILVYLIRISTILFLLAIRCILMYLLVTLTIHQNTSLKNPKTDYFYGSWYHFSETWYCDFKFRKGFKGSHQNKKC